MNSYERGEAPTDTLALDDEDRLPWLEAVDNDDNETAVSPGRLIGLVLGGLGALALLVGGIWWMQSRSAASNGEAELITAQAGDYKVAPADPGAKQFQGEGDASYKTSEGGEVDGKIDPTKAPETPATAAKADAPLVKPAPGDDVITPKAGAPKAAAATAPAAKAVATAEPATPATPAATGGGVVQLGAFDSQAVANNAWKGMAKRFGFLSGASHTVTAATVGGGTVYRLRASVGSKAEAADICAKMSAAGQNCMVVR